MTPLAPEQGGRGWLRRLAVDTLVLSAAQALNRAKGLVLIPLVVSGVGLDGYGAFVQILAIVQLLTSVTTLELGMGIERFASVLTDDEQDERGQHFWSVVAATATLATVGAAVFALASPAIADLLLAGHHQDALAIASFVLISNSIFSVARHQLRARRQFKLESGLSLLYQLGPYVALVVLVLARGDLTLGLIGYAAADAVAAATALVAAARTLPLRRPSGALLRRYARYSAPLALSVIEGSLLARVDLFFLGSMLGLEAVAAYNVAYRLCELLHLATGPIHVQLLAYLSGPWDRGEHDVVRRVLRHALQLLMLLAAGLIAGLIAYLDPLLALLLGDARPEASLQPVVLLVGLGLVANTIRRMLYVVIRLEQRTHRELLYQAIGLSINIAANLVLIPPFGLAGAAAATLLAYTAMLPFIARHHTIGLDLAFIGQSIWFACLAAVSAWLFAGLVRPGDLLGLAASSLATGLLYVALVIGTRWSWLKALRADLSGLRSEP